EYAHIPAKSDEVRFSDVTLMRSSGTKHIFILGANSSVFPKAASDTGLITQNERNLLLEAGIELGEDIADKVFDELFLAHSAICSASESCHVVYSEKNLSGEALYPSVIISAIEKITSNKSIRFDDRDSVNCFAGNDYLFDELSVLPAGKTRNTLIKYFSSLDGYSKKLDALLNSFSQKERLDAQTLRLIYGNTLITSYSRLEKFRGCPFAHFCTYTLKLSPEAVASLGPSEAGSIMHSVLEHLVPLLCKTDENGQYPDEQAAKRLVKQLLSQHLGNIAQTEQSTLPKRFVYLYGRLSRLLETLACNIVRELKVTLFKPRDFELNISSGGDISPVPIDIGNGCTLYIVGQIDRVDVYEKDGARYIRVIDYKTGKKSFKMRDIEKGFNLQMLLYLEAIRQRGAERYGGEILPAAVLYSNVSSSVQTLSLGDDIESASSTLISPTSSGVFLNDENVLFAMDSTENRIFLPVTEKNSTETLKSMQELGQLLDFAVLTAAELAKEIRAGLKSATPFDGKREGLDIDVCSYCDMKLICTKK
ncbi:MAG: PD-(D/E)XK nuclease family protein, partial [Clostridia bacterium]|nr:PD-(D/E)XK nuclease family protein [Clostridia bacterium]